MCVRICVRANVRPCLYKIDKLTYFVYKYNLIYSLGQLSVASIHVFMLLLLMAPHVTITSNTDKPEKTVYFCFFNFFI